MQVYSYAEELASQRRLQPKADLVSVLIDAEVEGEKLDQLELDLFFLLLIVAGNETTRNLMSGAMTAFFEHPDQWELLREDRSLLPGAVEEMLRYVTPVMHFRRTATADFELRGQEIKAGDLIGLPLLDDGDLTIGHVRHVVRTPEGKILLIVTHGGWLGPWFGFGARLVAVPIEVVAVIDGHAGGDDDGLASDAAHGYQTSAMTSPPIPR